MTFPESMRENQSYFSGLLNEELRPERKGGPLRWLKIGGGTGEPWDCFVYAYAAEIKAQQQYPAIDRMISGQSPFSVTTPKADDGAEIFDGPDKSAMSDKSEKRGLVQPQRTAAPKTAKRVQQGNTGQPTPPPEHGRLQQRKSRRSIRAGGF